MHNCRKGRGEDEKRFRNQVVEHRKLDCNKSSKTVLINEYVHTALILAWVALGETAFTAAAQAGLGIDPMRLLQEAGQAFALAISVPHLGASVCTFKATGTPQAATIFWAAGSMA